MTATTFLAAFIHGEVSKGCLRSLAQTVQVSLDMPIRRPVYVGYVCPSTRSDFRFCDDTRKVLRGECQRDPPRAATSVVGADDFVYRPLPPFHLAEQQAPLTLAARRKHVDFHRCARVLAFFGKGYRHGAIAKGFAEVLPRIRGNRYGVAAGYGLSRDDHCTTIGEAFAVPPVKAVGL